MSSDNYLTFEQLNAEYNDNVYVLKPKVVSLVGC